MTNFIYYITRHGFVYAAFVIDAFTRRIVCWPVLSAPNTSFLPDAFEQAIYNSKPDQSLSA